MTDHDPAQRNPSGSAAQRFRLANILEVVAGAVLFLLMAVMVADVIGRYLFSAPIPGAFEVIEILMCTVIFAAIPVATAHGEHIIVDLLDPVLPRRLTAALKVVATLLIAAVFMTLVWLLWELGQRTARSGWVTDTLRIPLAPVAYFAALMSGIAALLALRPLWLRSKLRD